MRNALRVRWVLWLFFVSVYWHRHVMTVVFGSIVHWLQGAQYLEADVSNILDATKRQHKSQTAPLTSTASELRI